MTLLQLGLMVGAASLVLLALVALCVIMVIRLRRLAVGTAERRRAVWHTGIIIVWTAGLITVAGVCWGPVIAERIEDRDGWKRYSPQQGGFSIRLPQRPTFESVPLMSPAGMLTQNIYGLDNSDTQRSYLVIYSDYPKGLLKKSDAGFLLHQSRDTILVNYHARLLSRQDITLDGYPGTEYAFRMGKIGEMHIVRAYLVKNRMYILLAGPGPESSPHFAEKFFNSFKLAE